MIGRDTPGAGGTPLWLITMTDMYILLMSLFFILFAIGLADRPTHERIERALKGPGPVALGQPFKTAGTGEGTVVTIGGETAPFSEGSWELLPEHRAVLADVRRWMRGRLNVVMVRGHTASNWEDSVVVEAGRVRPFGPQDRERRAELADPWLLSTLRANAVRTELARDDGGAPGVSVRRIRVRGDAFTSPLADTDSSDARLRHLNRRVEIVITDEQKPD